MGKETKMDNLSVFSALNILRIGFREAPTARSLLR
jgi:hypothetical protein